MNSSVSVACEFVNQNIEAESDDAGRIKEYLSCVCRGEEGLLMVRRWWSNPRVTIREKKKKYRGGPLEATTVWSKVNNQQTYL